MYLLQLWDDDHVENLALFETIEAGREFVRKIPGYVSEEMTFDEHSYEAEKLVYDELPDFAYVEYKGNLIPITKFSFDGDVDIFWQELPEMDRAGRGLVEGFTRVDAYSIENDDVEEYIYRREGNFQRCSEMLQAMGYEAARFWHGSEDGEAIFLRKPGQEDWHMIMHMDPEFVEMDLEEDFPQYVEQVCDSIK